MRFAARIEAVREDAMATAVDVDDACHGQATLAALTQPIHTAAAAEKIVAMVDQAALALRQLGRLTSDPEAPA